MLRGVRGATTAIANEPEAVRTATKNLLVAMTKANAVKPSDIAAVIFSSTPDLNAAFPASAPVRWAGTRCHCSVRRRLIVQQGFRSVSGY